MAQSASKASIWNPRFSNRRRAPFWLEAMRATILRSPSSRAIENTSCASTLPKPWLRWWGATSRRRRDAGCHSRATCHPARRARWCPGRLRFPEACAPDPPALHQEEQVVFRLLLDERLKGAAILGGHEAQGDTCAPDLGNPRKGSLGSLAGHESTVAR